jgi:hypothetical protein
MSELFSEKMFGLGLFCLTNTVFQVFSFHMLKQVIKNQYFIEKKVERAHGNIIIIKESLCSVLNLNDDLFNKLKTILSELKELKQELKKDIKQINDKFDLFNEIGIDAEFKSTFLENNNLNVSPKSDTSAHNFDVISL